MSTCETVYGCEVSDYDSATATAVCSNPPARRQPTPRANLASATSTVSAEPTVSPRQADECDDPTADIIVYMRFKKWSDAEVTPLVALLEERGVSFKRFGTDAIDGGFTPFLHVNSCPESLRLKLEQMAQVRETRYIYYKLVFPLFAPPPFFPFFFLRMCVCVSFLLSHSVPANKMINNKWITTDYFFFGTLKGVRGLQLS